MQGIGETSPNIHLGRIAQPKGKRASDARLHLEVHLCDSAFLADRGILASGGAADVKADMPAERGTRSDGRAA
jgi:hypothetical protein